MTAAREDSRLPDPKETIAGALAFARDRLGPACAAVLEDGGTQALVLSRLRQGRSLEDAVLGEIHHAAGHNPRVADEFLAFFLSDMMKLGHQRVPSSLRRFLDTGDLVQSVLGDLWEDFEKLRFETRGQFLAYLVQALRWKGSGHQQRMTAGNRREDLRVDPPAESLRALSEAPTPSSQAAAAEERERMALVLLRLPERDRELLRAFLKGESNEAIGAKLGLSPDAARMGIQRALQRARELL